MQLAPNKTAELEIIGPYSSSGVQRGESLPLPLVETSELSVDIQTEAKSVPSQGSDQTILAPLLSSEEFTTSGTIHPDMVESQQEGLSRIDTLREWLFRLESLCRSNQGAGYELVDEIRTGGTLYDPTGGSAGVLVSDASWDYTTENYLEAEWDIEMSQHRGQQPAEQRREQYVESQINRRRSSSFNQTGVKLTDTPSEKVLLDDLESVRMERTVDVNKQQILNNVDVGEIGIINSGVTREISIEGQLIERDKALLRSQIAVLEEKLRGSQVDLQETVTGRVFQGAINDVRTDIVVDVTDGFAVDVSVSFTEGAEPATIGDSGSASASGSG